MEAAETRSTEPGRERNRRIGFWVGLAGFVALLLFGNLDEGNPLVTRMAAVAFLMAAWWITDALPLAATALVPLVTYPFLGIMKGKEVAPVYVNYVIFLFIGGFLIALAMERWGLHRRIALNIIRAVGGSPARLVLGFMLATAFLSMWISNTATSIMMLAIGLAIISEEEEAFGPERTANLSVALLLGIAYSASIGGMATLVGTPPNLSLARIFEISFPGAPPLTFGQWMVFSLPLVALLLGVAWILLTRVFFRSPADLELSNEVVEEQREELGKISYEEAVVLAVFTLTALLWVFRKDLVLGGLVVPGWSRWLATGAHLDDGTVAISMAFLLFLFPARSEAHSEGYGTILDFGAFSRLPWHIILLFGGGFALAKGFQVSGLSAWAGGAFTGLQGAPGWLMTMATCGILTFLTELTSNTATTEMLLPILASAAVAMQMHPLMLMIPATLSASCAFMMPVATPPNAIVFGSGRIRIVQMVKVGMVLNLIGILTISMLFYWFGPLVFQMEPGVLPDWAGVPGAP